ncbi:helix-turn-helix domain-containing protein [Nonomuraea basaltis]|uniref:helix-turn-helix domain-containing protein n=1 Tax=Nonomuraea basaltis TaxID=2495887 RepID=UPI00197ED1C2|nr:helix-turn-helix domain-containing protein [Nonomuraea basaltis]
MSDTWTIGELAEHAARALRDGAPPANGRVRDVPGERLIRWYMTIGLVDPPLTRRGRIARYGRRHLLQLVAIKRLQAAGHSIADIQAALAGATDRMLEEAATATGLTVTPGAFEGAPPFDATPLGDAPRVSGPRGRTTLADTLPADGPLRDGAARHDEAAGGDLVAGDDAAGRGAVGDAAGRGAVVGGDDRGGRARAGRRAGDGARSGDEPVRGRFWAERPGKEVTHPAAETQADTAAADRHVQGAASGAGVADRRAGRGAVVAGVRLGDGVRLVLDAGRTPSEEDVQAVLAAAGPLLAVLEERELL